MFRFFSPDGLREPYPFSPPLLFAASAVERWQPPRAPRLRNPDIFGPLPLVEALGNGHKVPFCQKIIIFFGRFAIFTR